MTHREEQVIEIGLWVLVIAVTIGIGLWLSSYKCEARWSQSMRPTSWGPLQGCLVETEPHVWIPEDRVRELNPPTRPAEPLPGRHES